SVLPTIAAVAATIAATAVMLGSLMSLEHTMLSSGRPTNAVVLTHGADSEAHSTVKLEDINTISVAPGSKQVSTEYVTAFSFMKTDGHRGVVTVRGVDPAALEVRPEVRVGSGALPNRGSPGLLLGAELLGRYEDFNEGAGVRIGPQKWPIVGTISA